MTLAIDAKTRANLRPITDAVPFDPTSPIKAGDVVLLKSGSRKLSVERVENGSAHLVWSCESEFCRDKVPLEVLKKIDPNRRVDEQDDRSSTVQDER